MADSNNPAADGTRAENMPEAQDQTYVVEEILLDGILDGVSMWLVKWQGYPLEEATWEPLENFLGNTQAIDTFNEWKALKFPKDEGWPEHWDKVYNDVKEAEGAFRRRQQEEVEREAKEQELREKALVAKGKRIKYVVPDSDDEEDIPLMSILRCPAEGKEQIEAAIADQPAAQSDSDDEPVIKQRPRRAIPARISPLFEGSGQPPRKPPLEQSDSSTDESSSGVDSDDSFMAKKRPRKKGIACKVTSQRPVTRSVRKAATASTEKAEQPSRDSSASANRSSREPHPALRAQNSSVATTSLPKTIPSAAARSAMPPSPLPARSNREQSVFARRSAPSRVSAPIRMTIKPTNPKPVRKEWQNSDRHYNTLSMRYNAYKRSNREAAPDVNALEFVNFEGGSASSSKLAPAQQRINRRDDNIYGRREYTRARPSVDQDASPPPQPDQPETKKLPFTCWEWRNGSCYRGAGQCMYLHRETDPLVFSPIDGSVPPKYRKEPLTCFWWMRAAEGCNKPESQCLFAHKNTGLLADPDGGAPKTIDKNELPLFEKNPTGKKALTCYWYMTNAEGCNRSESECQYAHRNTGRLAIPNEAPKPIDPDQLPLTERNDHFPANPTCYHYMMKPEGCNKSESECMYAHRNTGLLAIPNEAPQPIDPNQIPLAERNRQRLARLTCYHYMRNFKGCRFSADECRYAHRNTGLLAGLNGSTLLLDPDDRPVCDRHRVAEGVPERFPTKNPKDLTCWYWHNKGSCNKTAEECKFSHSWTGQVAELPEWFKKGQLPAMEKSAENRESPLGESLPGDTLHKSLIDVIQASLTDDIGRGRSQTTAPAGNSFGRNPPIPRGSDPSIPNIVPTAVMAPPPAPNPNVEQGGNVAFPWPAPPTAAQRARPQLELQISDNVFVPSSSPTLGSALITPAASAVAAPPERVPCATMQQEIEEACKLDFDKIFAPNVDHDQIKHLERRVFLVFDPQQHIEEIELLTRWLMMHYVTVYNLWVDGSWDHFKKQILKGGSGVIIVHPEFERFWTIEDFALVLGENVRIWSVGYQMSGDCDPQDDPDIAPHETDCIEIFPQGGMILVTEDVFANAPAEAFRIVKLFVDKVNKCRAVNWSVSDEIAYIDNTAFVKDAAVVWRLVVRPELMDWTFRTFEENENQEEKANSQARYALYELLTQNPYIYQDDGTDFDGMPTDYYPIMSEHRDCADPYYEVREQGGVAALNNFMVENTAREIIRLRREYRHLYVVCTEPSKTDWAEKFQNITAVITPGRCIEELRKDSKESVFNFHEWDLPLKAADGDSGLGMDGAMELEGWVLVDQAEEEERGRSRSRVWSDDSAAMDTADSSP